MSKVTDWLKDEGVKILIILLIGIILYIGWRLVVHFITKGIIRSNIKTKELSRKTLRNASGIIDVVVDDVNLNSVTDEEKKQIENRAKTIGGVIRSIGCFIIGLIIVIQILDTINVPTTSLITGMAVFGLAVAFAIQTIVGDFASGLFILIEGSYNIDDTVTLNGLFGAVERLSLRLTTVRGLDGTLYTIPNGEIRTIQNHSKDFNVSVTMVGVTYESNIPECITKLNTIVSDEIMKDERVKDIIMSKPIVDGIGELAGSSVNIRFLIKSKPGTKLLVDFVSNEYCHKHLGNNMAYPTHRIIKD